MLMINFKRNNGDIIRINCTYCGKKGKLVSNDPRCTVVKCTNFLCGASWDGYSQEAEHHVYEGLK